MRTSDPIVFAALALRDGVRCYLCGQAEVADEPWHVEHVIPKVRGGSDDLDNLRLAHQSCNLQKGTEPVAL